MVDRHPAGFDSGHIQNIIDDAQQMLCRCSDFHQIVSGFIGEIRVIEGNTVKPDNGIHGGADFMAHVGEESGFRFIRLFRGFQCLTQCPGLGETFAGFRIHIGKAHADCVHQMIVPVFRVSHTGKTDHLVGLFPVMRNQIEEGDHTFLPQSLPDGIRLNKTLEVLPILGRDVLLPISGNDFFIIEGLSEAQPAFQLGIFLIADALVFIQLHVIDPAIIGGEGRDHLGVFQQLLLQGELFFQLLLAGLSLFIPGDFRNINTHAQGAEPARGVGKLQFGGLEISDDRACRIRHVLKKDIGLIHLQRLPVVLHKVGCGLGIEDLKIRQADHTVRRIFMGILGKSLVAGQIFAGLRIF